MSSAVAAPALSPKKKGESKVKKPRHTNRSRLSSSIDKIAKAEIKNRGKAPLSSVTIGLLEDICSFTVKRVAVDAARMLEGRSTIKLEIIRAALRLSIRAPALLAELDKVGMNWVTKYNAAIASAAPKQKIHLTSGADPIMPGHISPNRVNKMIRKCASGCTRLSFISAIYMAGVLNEIVGTFVRRVNSGSFASKAPHRLGINDFYNETKQDLDLNAIVPFSMIMQFGAEKHYMPRKSHKRSAAAAAAAEERSEEEESPSPPKKKARSAPKKKKHSKKAGAKKLKHSGTKKH